MASPIAFPGTNRTFNPPPGREDSIVPLPTFVNGNAIVSAWQLSDEEFEEVAKTRTVFVSIFSGLQLFPMFVGTHDVVRALIADTGPVWPTAERKCSNEHCPNAGTHYPVIRFGAHSRLPGQLLPYRIEVPKAVCMACQPGFKPDVYVTEEARSRIGATIADGGKAEPDFSKLIVTWSPIDDEVWTELKGGGEARFWF